MSKVENLIAETRAAALSSISDSRFKKSPRKTKKSTRKTKKSTRKTKKSAKV